MSRQNSRSTSRGGEGRPGDRIAGRPVCCVLRSFGHAIERTPLIEVLRRPLEFAQYTSIAFTDALVEAGIAGSIGSVGDALEGALMESTIGLYKTELIDRHQTSWSGRAEVERETASWVHWYNQARVHSSIGYLPPVEYEAAWRQGQEEAA